MLDLDGFQTDTDALQVQAKRLTRPLEQKEVYFHYKKDKYSQAGQDGIKEHIVNVLGIKKGHFVEFGAWDGINVSNCRKLFEEGWSGVFIEADKKRFRELQKNYDSVKQIMCINKRVEINRPNRLDKILNQYAPDENITFMSIDVNGVGLDIFESILEEYLPTVVCLEGFRNG